MTTNSVSKAVLITGCSTGIGRATALRLARGGHRVYASARRMDAIADLGAAGCQLLALDVCDEASMQAAVTQVEEREGAVGVLVNNAGYGSEGPVEEVPMEEIRRQFETNFFGLVRLTQLVLPGMRRQGWGRIINLSSMGGRMTLPGGGVYHATKYAVEALSDALRIEVKNFGIDVVIIEPGAIKTEFGRTAVEKVERLGHADSAYSAFRDTLKKQIQSTFEGPMARFAAAPDTVAKVIERAIESPRPRTRYLITFGAHLLVGLRRWLPDRAFDALVATQLPPPKPSA